MTAGAAADFREITTVIDRRVCCGRSGAARRVVHLLGFEHRVQVALEHEHPSNQPERRRRQFPIDRGKCTEVRDQRTRVCITHVPVVARGHQRQRPSTDPDAMSNRAKEVVIRPIAGDATTARREVRSDHATHGHGVKDDLASEIVVMAVHALGDGTRQVPPARHRRRIAWNGRRRGADLDALVDGLRREDEDRRQYQQHEDDDASQDLPKGFHARKRDWVNARFRDADGTMICRMGRAPASRYRALAADVAGLPDAMRVPLAQDTASLRKPL